MQKIHGIQFCHIFLLKYAHEIKIQMTDQAKNEHF